MANESESERPMNQQRTAARAGEPYILTARRCHTCGTLALRTENYCPCCGGSLRPTCQHCGFVIPHAIAFYCPECGGDLKKSADSP
ncbi:MAG: hypothetical protein IPM61_05535 [Chlorobi bacterium]|nr:MAG: Double zinc ribbon [Chlorobi bacterium OLB7]MBK8910775.1 hypothetical protein [Chlorobiota bacterium]MBX7216042.1 hypothetical protein [Candidatus Kapabacteria bacterium]